ncbi:hypothetical protein AYI69_g9685 [Smittium culicis]|uniref:Uncharacterized protein n=1 Tax=Smittium culicis TaxID=133412 RepID=A0A1R1XB34_9FUNG|nr:hypothetical protein AYI69_g9685 [Smittium culicis]
MEKSSCFEFWLDKTHGQILGLRGEPKIFERFGEEFAVQMFSGDTIVIDTTLICSARNDHPRGLSDSDGVIYLVFIKNRHPGISYQGPRAHQPPLCNSK